jgi:hypothetical protein
METFAITERKLAGNHIPSAPDQKSIISRQANPLNQIIKPVQPTTANKPAVSALQNGPLAGIWARANYFKPIEAKPNE